MRWRQQDKMHVTVQSVQSMCTCANCCPHGDPNECSCLRRCVRWRRLEARRAKTRGAPVPALPACPATTASGPGPRRVLSLHDTQQFCLLTSQHLMLSLTGTTLPSNHSRCASTAIRLHDSLGYCRSGIVPDCISGTVQVSFQTAFEMCLQPCVLAWLPELLA